MTKAQDPAFEETMRNDKSGMWYKEHLPIAMRNLKKVADAGVPVVMGTDSGPPARFQGYFEHVELDYMLKSGLTPMQALVASTSTAAARGPMSFPQRHPLCGPGADTAYDYTLGLGVGGAQASIIPPDLPTIVRMVEEGFELSEASNTPVILELRIRACHVHGSFETREPSPRLVSPASPPRV